MLSVIEIAAISSAILYFLPITTATRLRPGLIQRIFQIGPIGPGEHEFEFRHTSRIPQHIPPTPLRNVHPVRPAHQQRPRRPRHRNHRNNRRQEEQDVEALVTPPPGLVTPPPAPPYQAQENPIVHPNPPPVLPSFREPSIIILDHIQVEDHPSVFDQSPTPRPIVRIPRPILRSLSSDHINTRLAIRTGGAPLQRPPLHPTSTLTGWVINRESQRVKRYFWSDRHLDGASPLKVLSFPEAEESTDWTVKKALDNHQRCTRLVRYEIECPHTIHHIIQARIFNPEVRAQYFAQYTDLLDLRLEIQQVADSIHFLPSHYRFQFIPSYQTVLINDAQRRQDNEEE
ncbi:hypothetical protein FIBSPDRAFT_896494 [Athelia psychrophila]|uniref:Uncharacterized protein n=1 Tax=Athelia psychrophila TaxID=1759441 RepID=A0A166DEG7_9AGAM|nr:hypothetical protein FIBSPDRAFT_896494 [Fibularhizoctonia sp. CBS 109695]